MTKKQAGRKGGLSTFQKYGREYMRNIGRRGAQTFWKRYSLKPVGTSHFAIVCRNTNKMVAFTSRRFV